MVKLPPHCSICQCVRAQLCPTLQSHGLKSLAGSSVHGIFPGKNTGVNCHFLLQGIFPTQGSNLHRQANSLPLNPQGSPVCQNFILSLVIYSFVFHISCIHLSVAGHLGCFHLLAMMNNNRCMVQNIYFPFSWVDT